MSDSIPQNATGTTFELQKLAAAHNLNLNPYHRAYLKWDYLNPGRPFVPDTFSNRALFESWEREYQAGNPAPFDVVPVINELQQSAPGWKQLKEQERQVEMYLREKVLPAYVMDYSELSRLIDSLHHCHTSGAIGVKPGGGMLAAWDYKCSLSKLCPFEARAEGRRLFDVYSGPIQHWIENPEHSLQYWVLTIPNVPTNELHQGKRDLFKKYAALIKQFPEIAGSLVVQEDPLAAGADSWNIHLNVIVLLRSKFIDWQAVRRAWAFNAEFLKEQDMLKKTAEKLRRRGELEPGGKVSRAEFLSEAFRELAKYTTKLTGGKSTTGLTKHLDQAPGLTDWPPARFAEWWSANKSFRRSRSYGALYDPYRYIWEAAPETLRREWCKQAEVSTSLSKKLWKEIKQENRIKIKTVMDNRDKFNMDNVQWVGTVRFNDAGQLRVELAGRLIDLIQGHKYEDRPVADFARQRALCLGVGPPG